MRYPRSTSEREVVVVQRPHVHRPTVRVRRRRGPLAGRERKCFLVSVELPGSQKIRMIFSETGELARIDLPQDYQLLEPMIHGMIPSLPPTNETP